MHLRLAPRVCLALIAASAGFLISTVQLVAQTTAGAGASEAFVPDTGTWAEGREAGRIAARQRPVAGRAAAGFLGGLPAGFFGLLALNDGDRVHVLGGGGGLAVVMAATAVGRSEPPSGLASAGRGAAYSRGFAQGYGERLRARREAAALAGGAAGAAVGLGLLIALLSRVGT